jgi:hypothetical protein
MNCCILYVISLNWCLSCDIVVDAPRPIALENSISNLATKSESSKALPSYTPNSPLLGPAPAPIQEPDDDTKYNLFKAFALLFMFIFVMVTPDVGYYDWQV